MIELFFTAEQLNELQDIIIWAISEGYNTNKFTKDIAYKIMIDHDTLQSLDDYNNVGEKLISD